MRQGGWKLFSPRGASGKAMVSALLGAITVPACIAMFYLDYKSYMGGASPAHTIHAGAVVLLCFFLSLAGMIIGVLARREPDQRYLFAYVGMVLNGLVLLSGFILLYVGME